MLFTDTTGVKWIHGLIASPVDRTVQNFTLNSTCKQFIKWGLNFCGFIFHPSVLREDELENQI